MDATKFLKSLARRLLVVIPHKHNLDILARKHGTDKHLNRYTVPYQHHFSPIRRRKLNVLEIGVGGGRHPTRGGASLRMWQDYFRSSMIYGIDLYDKSHHEDQRIKIFQGDQSDPIFLTEVANEIGRVDIVIDDGSHINEHMLVSFHTLFPFLADNGIYVIEDLCTSYWPQYGGEWENLDNDFTVMAMLKRLADGLHYSKIPNYAPSPFDEHVISIQFYHSLAFVFKGENKPPLSGIDYQILEENRRT